MTRLLRLAPSNPASGLWAILRPLIGPRRASDTQAPGRDQVTRDHHEPASLNLDRLEL